MRYTKLPYAHPRTRTLTPAKITILVACEESQAVCLAFREKGFTAFSADLQQCSGSHPEFHIVGDVTRLLSGHVCFTTQDGNKYYQPGHWHLIIAHPPCTYLSMVSASGCKGGIINNHDRLARGWRAASFFLSFFDINCRYLAVENPVPLHIFNLPRPTTMVQPYWFGHPWSKRTCLWLRNLPPLMPTAIVPKHRSWTHCYSGSKKRSKTFPGIARAMAEQWGKFILNDLQNLK